MIGTLDAKIPAGQLRSARSDLVLEVRGALDSAERIRRVPLREEEGGRFLRVGDVATVEKTLRQPPATLALVDGSPGVVVGAKMQANRRVDQWAARAREEFERFERTLPDPSADLHSVPGKAAWVGLSLQNPTSKPPQTNGTGVKPNGTGVTH